MKLVQLKPSKGFLLSICAAFLGSLSLVNNRQLLINGENPLNIVVWIGIFASIPWTFFAAKHQNEFFKLSVRNKSLLLIIGIASSIGIQYLQSLALANTSATNFAFLYRTVTVFTIIFAAIFLKEKITRSKWLLVCLILVGAYLFTAHGQSIKLSIGDGYSLLVAAIAAFVANILIKKTISKMHPDLSGAATQIIATCSLLVLAHITGVFETPQHIWLVLLGGIFSFGQIILRNRAYQHASASFVSMVYSLSPLFVVAVSAVAALPGEKLGVTEIIGGIVIISATLIAEKLKI